MSEGGKEEEGGGEKQGPDVQWKQCPVTWDWHGRDLYLDGQHANVDMRTLYSYLGNASCSKEMDKTRVTQRGWISVRIRGHTCFTRLVGCLEAACSTQIQIAVTASWTEVYAISWARQFR